MNTIDVIFILIGLAIGAIFVYLILKAKLAMQVSEIQSKEKDFAKLENQKNEALQQIENLKNNISTLKEQNSASNKEIELLNEKAKDLKDLQNKIDTQNQTITNLQSKNSALEKENDLQSKKIAESTTEINNLRETIGSYQKENVNLKSNNSALEKENRLQKEDINKNLDTEKQQKNKIEDLQNKIEEQQNTLAKTYSEKENLETELTLLKEQVSKEAKERTEAFNQHLELAKEQLKNATQDILKQREESLGKSNTEQISKVVDPLKESIENMKKTMTENIKSSAENKTSIEKTIETLMKKTEEIGNDANNLAKALKNESKTQGNWGELILEKILEGAGLTEGVHYEKQMMMRDNSGNALTNDDTGKKMIPDIVLHYPDNKDVIIDSKASLSAYLDFCNAETEEDRNNAINRHLVSVRNHVKELQSKKYDSYIKPPRKSINYVIMFIPNETAMQLALFHDKNLWKDSFEKGIFITSEQNLFALLRMIQLSWSQFQQAKNQEEVFSSARKLLDRVSDFIKKHEELGEKIEKVSKSYEESRKKLYSGNQSLVKAANEMQKLGAKTTSGKELLDSEDYLLTN